MEINHWQIRYFDLFAEKLSELEREVTQLQTQDPDGYKSHPQTKLLASLYRCILELVPRDPMHRDFFLGNILGKENRHWRRVKQGMPYRYRLFFQFGSVPVKTIVYVWFNDQQTLRKEDAKTDVYEVFKRMLKKGQVPASLEELIKQSSV